MKTTTQKAMLALLGITFCFPFVRAGEPAKSASEINSGQQETAELMAEKFHSEVSLTAEQKTQITELTIHYLQQRQAMMEKVGNDETLSKEFINQLKEIEDQYQASIDEILLPAQKEEAIVKQEEKKNVAREEAIVAVQEAKQAVIDQAQSDKNESSKK